MENELLKKKVSRLDEDVNKYTKYIEEELEKSNGHATA
jgi:hypothetical protein